MSMPITALMIDSGPVVFYQPEFHTTIESHLKYLREHPDTTPVTLDPHDVYKYEYDLFGLLSNLGIPNQYHWTIMRVNDFSSPADLTRQVFQLLMPSNLIIDRLRQSHKTASRSV